MTFGYEHTLAICATLQYSYGQHNHNLWDIFLCNTIQLASCQQNNTQYVAMYM